MLKQGCLSGWEKSRSDGILNVAVTLEAAQAKKSQSGCECEENHPLDLTKSIKPGPRLVQYRLNRIASHVVRFGGGC